MIDNVKENGAYIVISPEFALPHEGFDRGCNPSDSVKKNKTYMR